MSTIRPSLSQISTSLATDGFIHIPSLIPPSSPLFSALLSSARFLTSRARTGSWPYVRTVPKQFPPWNAADAVTGGIWGVQHLLHPALPEAERTAFAEVYFSDEVLDVVKVILGIEGKGHGAGDEQLVMELFNLLVTPGTMEKGRDFELKWHRDDVGPEITGAVEEAALGLAGGAKTYSHTQFNLSLAAEEDCSLIVVPGSHARARTAEEVQCMKSDAYGEIPGQITVRIRAGDVVFYDNNILHRAAYAGDRERWTLHGSYSRKGVAKNRARNVLQHGVGTWIGVCRFEGLDERLQKRAEIMKDGLVQMGSEGGWKGEYSLQG